MQGLHIDNIHKSFGNIHALNGVSFDVYPGDILAVLGPSGCGKSTLLSIIAGLETPDQGDIFWDGENIKQRPTHLRDFGLMFQDYALFPHMNVYDNLAFGLNMAHWEPEHIKARVDEMLTLIGLTKFTKRNISSLSGGEQQRVALARSLATQPRLLMLDEPLGALDRTLRERLLFELRTILRRIQQTTVYVTHDQEEAFTLADRVVVLNAGQVAQVGSPQDIYHNPASVFIARFLGFNNLLPGHINMQGNITRVETALGLWLVNLDANENWVSGEPVSALLRPDRVSLAADSPYQMKGRLIECSFRGNLMRLLVETEHHIYLNFDLPSQNPIPKQGELIHFSFNPQAAVQVFKQPQDETA